MTRHDNICYHITDIPEDLSVNKTGSEYVMELSQKIITPIEDILGYVFRSKQRIPHIGMGNENSADGMANVNSVDEHSDDQIDGDTNIHQTGCLQMLFRCSQDKASASYSKRPSKKRRRRKQENRYPCCGRIRLTIPHESKSVKIHLHSIGDVHLGSRDILLYFRHKCHHPPRERMPVPATICTFIKDPVNASRSVYELYMKLLKSAKRGELGDVSMTDVTDDNVRYWWSQLRREVFERDPDPWKSAVKFLEEQENTVVHSHIYERRKSICWYIPALLNIDISTVTEVYVDSTHTTNGQKAELFAIIGCESGYGVPLGYMLMEKKPTDDSREFPGEVIDCCTRFLSHAKDLGLLPLLVHIDKCAAEIAAIKVSI
jgi:hypothetical protein